MKLAGYVAFSLFLFPQIAIAGTVDDIHNNCEKKRDSFEKIFKCAKSKMKDDWRYKVVPRTRRNVDRYIANGRILLKQVELGEKTDLEALYELRSTSDRIAENTQKLADDTGREIRENLRTGKRQKNRQYQIIEGGKIKTCFDYGTYVQCY